MRIESVTAVAFGPFKGATLELSPQLTVVYGPNEAGKSTWHAAIYASLCGMRRAGTQSAEDRDFCKLRRPWSGNAWEVRAVVRLDNGQRIELRQDFQDLAHCSAIDADLGRDVAPEILNEGTPDAARWLGLDRHSFLAVACVRQAQIQSLAENADSLQDDLQRAAASAAKDSTTAEVIVRLEDFQREQVGQDLRHSTKPLRRAKVREGEAWGAVASAREKHAEWLGLEVQARRLAEGADDWDRKLRVLHALRAQREAESWRTRLARARVLRSAYAKGQPTVGRDDALADEVAAALSLWANRPELPLLTGPSGADIRAEIQKLPPMPSGDQAPRAEVLGAMRAYERAVQALEIHQTHQPTAAPPPDTKGLVPNQLRELARALETPVPSVDDELEIACREARRRVERTRTTRLRSALIAGFAAASLLGGAGAWVAWNHWAGAALALFGIAAFVWFVVGLGERDPAQASRALRLEVQLLAQRKAAEDARGMAGAARAQIVEAALPADSAKLRELADEILVGEHYRKQQEQWSQGQEGLQSDLSDASGTLADALKRAGAEDVDDLNAAFQQYEQACQGRARQADRAAVRDSLIRQLSDREAAERAAAEAQTRRSNAKREIMAALAGCHLEAPDPKTAIHALRRWQDERKARLVKFDEATRDYAELNALLDGGTLEDMEARASEYQRQAEELAAASGPLPEVAVDLDLEQEIQTTEKLLRDAELSASEAESRARDRAQDVPSIAEAEEALTSAQQELERVERLKETLDLTLDFLRKAEERVHRDMAPHLAAGLRRWLPSVTQHRYGDARVDPRDLSVQVLGPDNEWRDARLLSHGTAEQIYLLLRVALAERLATTGETCPLILDDVLVQSDLGRKRALLESVLSISGDRQVILFTQEDEVLRWAQAHLTTPNRSVVLQAPLHGAGMHA